MYAPEIEIENDPGYEGTAFMTTEFVKTPRRWICPDVEDFSLFNDPDTFTNGRDMVMVVNQCEIAQAIDQA